LDDLLTRKQHILVGGVDGLRRLIRIWRDETDAVRRGIRPADGSFPHGLSRLADPAYLVSLIEVRRPAGRGLGFLAPVIIAWVLLAIVEYRYQGTNLTESLFAWWARDRFFGGPHLFSGVVAVSVLLVLIKQLADAKQLKSADAIEVEFRDLSIQLAAGVLALDHQAGPASAPLHLAADRLGAAASELSAAVGALSSHKEQLAQHIVASQNLEHAANLLGSVSADLGKHVQSLEVAVGSLAPVLSGWEQIVEPITRTADGFATSARGIHSSVGALEEALQDAAAQLKGVSITSQNAQQTAQWTAEAAPALEKASNDLTCAVEQLVRSQASLEKAADKAWILVSYADAEHSPNGHGAGDG
jgi:hypothetical protein